MAENRDFIFGVDLDGVCGDYTAAFREVVASETGRRPEELGDERSWDFAEWGLRPEQFQELHRVAVLEHHMFRTMPIMDGTADALWRLSDAGVWVRLITHRLYVNWGHAVVLEDTAAWLDTAGIPYRDICFLGQKPEVEADLYVDDAPHNVAALLRAGNDVVVFDQPYNRDVDAPRARDWPEVEQLTLAALARSGRWVQHRLPGVEDPTARLRAQLARNQAAVDPDDHGG